MKMFESEISIYPRCPACGGVMYIPEHTPRYFICDHDDCINRKKYKVPTIELEEF